MQALSQLSYGPISLIRLGKVFRSNRIICADTPWATHRIADP
jgi:hypothetical protein